MAAQVDNVVIFVQENHTTDNYFRSMAAYGANVATGWPTSPNPPAHDQPHDRRAYWEWLTGQLTGAHVQFDTTAALPFYAWLAASGAFFENHCAGFGTNSTPNHLLIVGGQSPTLRNPPRGSPQPVWDLPSLPGQAEDNHISWGGYTAPGGYPLEFYQQLKGSTNIQRTAAFTTQAAAGTLPRLSMVWHGSGTDEHPPANVTTGHDEVWRAVDAVVTAGGWDRTVFMLTWDDWGGYDDHVATPAVEYTPDNVQLAYGPRIGLLMFGGAVLPGIDSRWCSHVSITRTALQLLGLPPLGVPRVDDDRGLADRVGAAGSMPAPPKFGGPVVQPPAPTPLPAPNPLPPSPVVQPVPVGAVLLRDGSTLPPPNDQPLPAQPKPRS